MPSGIYSSYNKHNNCLDFNGGEIKEIIMIRQNRKTKKEIIQKQHQ